MTVRRRSLEALCLAVCCLAAAGCDPGGGSQNPNHSGQDPLLPGTDPCASIDPVSCEATKGCTLVTTCAACKAGEACPALCQVSCTSVPQPPPPPPPSKCAGLDEAVCKATPGCVPLYGGTCLACAPGSTCPPCSIGFLGCGDAPVPPPPPPVSKCDGLGERACNATSGCQGVYRFCPANARCACPVDADCAIEPTLFDHCQPDVLVCGGPGGTEPGAPPAP